MTMRIDKRLVLIVAAALGAAVPGVAAADDAVSESDRFFLTEAENACASGDFPAFLWPYANSAAVRARYTALMVVTGAADSAREEAADLYLARDDFPIVMIDYSYVTGASARRFDVEGDPARLDYVAVDFGTLADDGARVDWVPGRFEPGEGDGPGTLIEKTGPGGRLEFERTIDCWRLTGDIREAAGAR
ncbi:hypothetical protein EAO27_00655 [Sphingopyxis sp. YF1]|nr:hypothetical protein EAO27_00655 [Sphingopyxis sp. YF1]